MEKLHALLVHPRHRREPDRDDGELGGLLATHHAREGAPDHGGLGADLEELHSRSTLSLSSTSSTAPSSVCAQTDTMSSFSFQANNSAFGYACRTSTFSRT